MSDDTPAPRPARRTGRPSKITQPVATLEDGTLVTAQQRIVKALRIGDYLETAAAAAGVHRDTVHHWLTTGANATARTERARTNLTDPPELTPFEEACRSFSDAVAQATWDWHQQALAQLEVLARGGLTTVTETVKADANGNTVETTTRTETLAPNAQVLMWRLTRRFPDRYAQRVDVHAEGWGPTDEREARAGSLADDLEAFQAGVVAGLEAARDGSALAD